MWTELDCAISPRREMESYETLWAISGITMKGVAELFRRHPGLPSEVYKSLRSSDLVIATLYEEVEAFLSSLSGFAVSVRGAFQHPRRLEDARYPLHLFYYRGYIGLTETPCVSVVGARKATSAGLKRAERLARELVEADYTIVSGLAAGIDTAAMTAAMAVKAGRTIGVIGTPLTESYPKVNEGLQREVASKHLLISQVPFYRYAHQSFQSKRIYFPERNVTMAALSEATVIVEASDTSGSLTQARAAIQQGRKLFILNSCFEMPGITWPSHYETLGAIRVKRTSDIIDHLNLASSHHAVDAD